MCGIAGILDTKGRLVKNAEHSLSVMNHLQKHRGTDGEGIWVHPKGFIDYPMSA